jgi:hypothetical protein
MKEKAAPTMAIQKARARKKGTEKNAEETTTENEGKEIKNVLAKDDEGGKQTKTKVSLYETVYVFHEFHHWTSTAIPFMPK